MREISLFVSLFFALSPHLQVAAVDLLT